MHICESITEEIGKKFWRKIEKIIMKENITKDKRSYMQKMRECEKKKSSEQEIGKSKTKKNIMSTKENTKESIKEEEEKKWERIRIDGEIVPQGRPRFARRGSGMVAYDPKKSKDFKTKVSYMAKSQRKTFFEDAIEIYMIVYRKVPKSWSKKRKSLAKEGKILPFTRPDIDNYAKGILDGMNGIVFKDDGLICKLTIEKRYGEDGADVWIRERKETEQENEHPIL